MTLALPSTRDEAWRYSDIAALAEVWPVAAPERILVPAGERAARHLIQTAAEDAVAVCDYVIEIEDGARLDFHILNMGGRSEEHTSELQSLMRISYAVFCLKKKKNTQYKHNISQERYQRQKQT